MNNRQTGLRSPLRTARTTSTTRTRLTVVLAAGWMLTAGAGMADGPRAAQADVAAALGELPQVEVLDASGDGVPRFMRGDLGRVPRLDAKNLAGTQQAMRAVMAPMLAPLRLQPSDLRLRKINSDEQGNLHLRYHQTHQGLDVVGGDLIVHVDGKGRVYAVNGTARGDVPATLGRRQLGESAVHALAMRDKRFAGMATTPPRTVFLLSEEGVFSMAYETVVTGTRGEDPVRDKVYLDVETGAVLAVHPQIHFALNRQVFSANNTPTLPGTLKRSEGGGASSDVDVNAAYEATGATYAAYKAFWNRDSFDNAGGRLLSSVHYGNSYCNAFWDGTRLVFGDGNSSIGCRPLARAQDIVAHELTHAVTADESGLVDAGESGALNEALSDMFGAFTEAFVDGAGRRLVVSPNTWKIGEAVMGRDVRFMNDPAADGRSLDFYAGNPGTIDTHHSAGIANLAFYLMSQGGRHPRGKSPINVAGIGMDKAIRVFYEASVNQLTSTSGFRAAALATVQAAADLGYSAAERQSIANAWQAVGVGVVSLVNNGAPVPPVSAAVVLANNVPTFALSDISGSKKLFKFTLPAGHTSVRFTLAGGGGDADLYVRLGAVPSVSAYDCRPFAPGNAETCTFNPARAGVYYVMLNGYSAYSYVTLTASSTAPGPVVLANGQTIIIDGTPGIAQEWSINVPAGKTLRVALSGGTGDASLAVGFGTASTMLCVTPVPSTNDACTVSPTSSGSYRIRVSTRSGFQGVSLRASY